MGDNFLLFFFPCKLQYFPPTNFMMGPYAFPVSFGAIANMYCLPKIMKILVKNKVPAVQQGDTHAFMSHLLIVTVPLQLLLQEAP